MGIRAYLKEKYVISVCVFVMYKRELISRVQADDKRGLSF